MEECGGLVVAGRRRKKSVYVESVIKYVLSSMILTISLLSQNQSFLDYSVDLDQLAFCQKVN